MPTLLRMVFMAIAVAILTDTTHAEPTMTLEQALQTVQKIGPKGQGHQAAIPALELVSQQKAEQLPKILAGMQGNNILADNWIRGAIDSIAEKTLQSGAALPLTELESYLTDTSNTPRSRRLAFEWIVQADPEARARLVPKLIDDPSLELRREAVSDRLQQAEAAHAEDKKDAAIAMYRSSLDAARDIDQIQNATDKLRELGETVNLPEHFGFVTHWYLIAPFDNTDQTGFEKAYPPESSIDLDESYEGKDGTVTWQQHTTDDEYGMVNLNDALGKHKGAVAYAVAFFDSDSARPIDLRLGSINANKIWLNGQELTANHVYHAGRGIDQYVGTGQLKKGANVILLKICQNEQTESWAQDWEFQLRVCDALGTAVLASNRASE